MQIQRKGRAGGQASSGNKNYPEKGPIGVGEAVATVDGKKVVSAVLTFAVG